VMPTFLHAAEVDPSQYDFDGIDMLDNLIQGACSAGVERDIFWEQGDQTSVRRGNWKLVLNGRLVEEEGPVEDVFLSDLATDSAESRNLADEHPELTAELTASALQWRRTIENYWQEKWVPELDSTTSYMRPSFHR
ncbi:MAG: hypothetical protein WBQ44_17750, partial [Rhodococcus sp. (in: high G+C Gram-positive bacteria)]